MSLIERAGLFAINAMARGTPLVRETLFHGEHERHALDWYRLPDSPNAPAVIFFYGGNWRSGRRQDYRFIADTLATLGCASFIADYRLYPHVRFGEILEDAIGATRLALSQLGEQQPVFLMGHSAGAQIAALLSLDPALVEGRERITGMIGLAGPYDFYPFSEDDHFDLFGPEEHYPQSQPVNFVRPDAPALYLLHGREDNRVRRGHSKSLMEKQQAVGGRAEREVYDDLGHVDILLEFIRPRRARSPVVRDVRAFINSLAPPSC